MEEKIDVNFDGKNILVVEDDSFSRILLSEIFKPTKAKIIYTSTANEALDFVRNNPEPNYVMLDIQLPDMDGVELGSMLRKQIPNSKIIAVTACVCGDVMSRCYKAGMSGFVSKPVKINELFNTMTNCN